MISRFKILAGLILTVVTIGVLSISTYAATMFSLGEPTIDTYVIVPVYLETTDYDYIGGYHFFIEYPEDYTYVRFQNKITDEWGDAAGTFAVDTSVDGRRGVAWAYGYNKEISGKLLLGNFYFTNTSVTDADKVLLDLSLRPQQFTYIANVGDTSINNGNGTKAIMDITEAATYITFDIPKSLDGWENGCIEKIYLSSSDGKEEIGNIIENDDCYTVTVRLRLNENDNKVIGDFTLLADTANTVGGDITAEGVVLKEFSSVVVENMNVISD